MALTAMPADAAVAWIAASAHCGHGELHQQARSDDDHRHEDRPGEAHHRLLVADADVAEDHLPEQFSAQDKFLDHLPELSQQAGTRFGRRGRDGGGFGRGHGGIGIGDWGLGIGDWGLGIQHDGGVESQEPTGRRLTVAGKTVFRPPSTGRSYSARAVPTASPRIPIELPSGNAVRRGDGQPRPGFGGVPHCRAVR